MLLFNLKFGEVSNLISTILDIFVNFHLNIRCSGMVRKVTSGILAVSIMPMIVDCNKVNAVSGGGKDFGLNLFNFPGVFL